MFPNVRLMIVAMFASIVAIGCGLGMFAAFRVNHEPLARLQSGSPPLQLVFGNGAPAAISDAAMAPFGVRFQLNAPVAMPAASDHALPAAPGSAPAAASAGPGQQAGPDANFASEQGTSLGDAAVVALQSPANPAAPADPASHDANAGPGGATSAAADTTTKSPPPLAAKTAHTPARHRVAKLRRIRQPQATTAAQPPALNFAVPPNYPSESQAAAQTSPAPQAIQRRVAVKRRRPTKQTAAKQAVDRTTVIGGASTP
jgi:hypothetical protein